MTAEHASGVGTAYDATVSTASATSATAEHASGSGVAYDATVQTAGNTDATAEHAAGTGAAYDATAQTSGATSATAEHASGSGSALDATVLVASDASPTAGHASGSGSASNARVSLGVLTAAEIDNAITASATRVISYVDVYNSDMSPYQLDIAMIEGNVTVDGNRDERRRADLTIYNDGTLDAVVGELWYDKIIQLRRGVESKGVMYAPIIFTGKIETRSMKHFGNDVKLACRDMSIVLAQEFGIFEEYAANDPLDIVIRDIALAGGLSIGQMNLPNTGLDIGTEEIVYTPSAMRWASMRQLADSHNMDLWFDAEGVLQLTDKPRLVGSPISHVFTTGMDGNIGDYSMNQSPTNIFNVVAVVGERTSNDVSYYGVAEDLTGTPTSVDVIGRRPITVSRPEITDNTHAQNLADRLLEDYTKERFDIQSKAIPDPRWEANTIIEFDRVGPEPAEVNRYLLESFNLNIKPGPSSIKISRLQTP
ncbi:MAG: hypothetical protein HKN37_12940 [Rhodothermales bacterium]|nr:hypothetical protein [Rhodothermales bacterium]